MVRPGEGRRRCGPGLALSADVEQLLVLSQLIVDSCDHVGGWVNGFQNHGRVVFFTFLDGAQKLYRECKGQPSWGSQHTTGQVCIQSLFLMSASAPLGTEGLVW